MPAVEDAVADEGIDGQKVVVLATARALPHEDEPQVRPEHVSHDAVASPADEPRVVIDKAAVERGDEVWLDEVWVEFDRQCLLCEEMLDLLGKLFAREGDEDSVVLCLHAGDVMTEDAVERPELVVLGDG